MTLSAWVSALNISIYHLFEYPEYYPTVARWIHYEWWVDKPGHSVKTMEDRLRLANDPDKIPLSLLALSDGVPVGTVNLVENDAEDRPDLYPWLAAMLVQSKYRGHGIGTKLVNSIISHAVRLGISEIFLGTDIPEFYERLGATDHECFADNFRYMKLVTGA